MARSVLSATFTSSRKRPRTEENEVELLLRIGRLLVVIGAICIVIGFANSSSGLWLVCGVLLIANGLTNLGLYLAIKESINSSNTKRH